MNFGAGFPFPQENEITGTWIPVTPEKPIPTRSQPIPVDKYGNQLLRSNWQSAGFPNGYIQERSNFQKAGQNFNPVEQLGQNGGYYEDLAQKNRMINHIAGSFVQASSNDGASWNNNTLAELLAMKNASHMAYDNRTIYRGVNTGEIPFIPNLDSRVDSNWQESNLAAALLTKENPPPRSRLLRNGNSLTQIPCSYMTYTSTTQNRSINTVNRPDLNLQVQRESNSLLSIEDHCSGSNPLCNSDSLEQIPGYGFPIDNQHAYNQHSSLGMEAEAASSVTTSMQFAPITPDQGKKLENNQRSAVQNFIDNSLIQKKDQQENVAPPMGNEAIQRNSDELLQNLVNSSSASIFKPIEKNGDNGSNQGIDLNKTPAEKPPKRRKVRPKVVRESKPKNTANLATPKTGNPKESPSGKRKYVRKKGLNESASQQAEVTRETTDPNEGRAAKSCRRALNFDSEKSRDELLGEIVGQGEKYQRNQRVGNLNSDSRGTESFSQTNSFFGTVLSAEQIGQSDVLEVANQQPGTTSNFNPSMNQRLADKISIPERQPATASLASSEGLQTDQLHARYYCTDSCQNSIRRQVHAKGLGTIVFQAKTNFGNLERARQLLSQGSSQLVSRILPSSNEARGYNRGYLHTMQHTYPHTVNPMSSSLLVNQYHRYGSNGAASSSENHMRTKTENGIYTNMYSRPCVEAVNNIRQAIAQRSNHVGVNGFSPQLNHVNRNSYSVENNAQNKPSNGVNNFRGAWPLVARYGLPNQYVSPEAHSCTARTGESHQLKEIHNFTSLTTYEKHSLLPPTPPKNIPSPEARQVHKFHHLDMPVQRQITGSALSKSVSLGTDNASKQHKGALYDYQQSPTKKRGRPKKQIYPPTIDDIIYQLHCLNLNGSNNTVGQEQNALVPYKREGNIVPYELFNFIKKRKARPKVDLDPETNRTWKLLMGIEGGEELEGTDKDKEKWWEEERKVFRGRADSFIARMHLVQGDRRFSRWKGSVVDSVIGVFLTQNVSDHLSSSAFMSLAARFPLKSTSNRECNSNETTILVEEPEVCIVNIDETIKWHEKISSHTAYHDQSSIIPHQSMAHPKEGETPGIERTLLEGHNQNAEEEVISSQDSFDSSVIQGSGGIRSYSSSNSEAEDPTSASNFDKISASTVTTTLLQMDKSSTFQEFYSNVNGSSIFDEISNSGHNQSESIVDGRQSKKYMVDNLESSSTFAFPINSDNLQKQVPVPSNDNQLDLTPGYTETEYVDLSAGESICSWPSTAKDANCTSKTTQTLAENACITTVKPFSQETLNTSSSKLSSRNLTHQQDICQPGFHYEQNQPPQENHQQERNKTFHLETTSAIETVKLAEAPATRHNNTMLHTPNVPKLSEEISNSEERMSVMNKQVGSENIVESNLKEKMNSFAKDDQESKSKVKKRKNGSEEKNAIDWDSLRKQVQPNSCEKERSKDAMDSLDYEALRCANVNEISDAIKERGMNNMLAERMKEFLNRLVKDHGSIDLEWLRDVPPEKTKDYLLSIRGLGLKSVECVRLLTLHHLAFPVDTNVGRIAVRLGWVPLQPLPESLQLHLLELYPVLESIQKYLWPRLCKLDQRTLYELHYQMITFGKVFCTKSKPNCNACPMRGECRHFASAFASARLTLPAPEDKSIVSSKAPTAAERNPLGVINSVPLALPENNSSKEAGPEMRKCEPIIEEPATPEQECTEISESDIEDTFYEDPDEIPTIKLNIEEFTMNLQNYMQQNNLEIQEVDMSKALVALNPGVASIPTPKLKNVSRLRTEHQVYELPDSHPLIKGMDKREPDDPSPYLLAIWAPGETANSIQPPEGSCDSQQSETLCSEKTCISCNTRREASSQTVRGTLLIPCRTAMRGSFPLNGTYFQVNEMFADHDSSINPIDVPRAWIWNLPRRTVYFGTSVSTIFKGLSTEDIQYCFWRGFVCVRGFDQKARAPRPLMARLHFPASKLAKTKK